MKKHTKNLHHKVQQKVEPKTEWKSLPPKDKRNAITVLSVIVILAIALLYILFVGSDFVYREEQQLDKMVNYIFIPFFIIVILISLFSKSLGTLISAIFICGIFVYPAMENIVMFLNVKIGDQKEEMISGKVIEKKMTGNKHITDHYKVKTDKGEIYTFMYGGHVTCYEVNDPFRHLMKRGCLGILYQEFKQN